MQALFLSFSVKATNIKPEIIDKAYRSVVTIEARSSISAYKTTGKWSGTGFITNLKKGLIVTNRHVISQGSIGNYLITFFNGQKIEAKPRYDDSWLDFAVLEVDPKLLPKTVTEITFVANKAAQNQRVFIIGNNEGQDFSFHEGYLSNLFSIEGDMPQHTYVVNLNAQGGSSGSPLINEQGEAVGLNYGRKDTYALSVKGEYILDVLTSLQSDKEPARKHSGVICDLYSLDQAVRHRNFPRELMQEYLKNFPDTRNNILMVKSIIKDSPAYSKLKSGDIIWEVNSTQIGASLYDFDKLMNNNQSNKINLTIFRDGAKISTDISLYDINQNKIKKMVEFGGAIFFESDDFFSQKSGMPIKSVAVANILEGMSMSAIPQKWRYGDKSFYRIKITRLDGHDITNLDSLINAIANLKQRKFIKIEFANFQPYYQGWDDILISDHENSISDITLDSIDLNPRIFTFNEKTMEWEVGNVDFVKITKPLN